MEVTSLQKQCATTTQQYSTSTSVYYTSETEEEYYSTWNHHSMNRLRMRIEDKVHNTKETWSKPDFLGHDKESRGTQ